MFSFEALSVGSSNSIYDRNRRRCSESVFSWICTELSIGGSRGCSTGVGTTEGRAGQYRKRVTERVPIGMTVVRTTEGRTDGEVVGVAVCIR